MTKHEIENKVNQYNNGQKTMSTDDLSKLFAAIKEDCKKLNGEMHKATLDALVSEPAQAAIILQVVDGVNVDKVKADFDGKTGKLVLRTNSAELEWAAISKAYTDKHGTPLAKDSTFSTEIEGFFMKLLKCNGAAISEGGAAAIIRKKDNSEAVNTSDKAISKTQLMKNLQQVCDAFLPEDIAIKVVKRDLNWLLSGVNGGKGRGQQSATNKTMYRQFYEVIKHNRSGEPYSIKCKL